MGTNDDNGVIYHLPHSLLDDLKNHYKYYHDVEQWYKELVKEDRKKVIRTNFTDDGQSYNDGDFIE